MSLTLDCPGCDQPVLTNPEGKCPWCGETLENPKVALREKRRAVDSVALASLCALLLGEHPTMTPA